MTGINERQTGGGRAWATVADPFVGSARYPTALPRDPASCGGCNADGNPDRLGSRGAPTRLPTVVTLHDLHAHEYRAREENDDDDDDDAEHPAKESMNCVVAMHTRSAHRY